MGIRDTLKKREEQREAAQNGGPSDLPEGVKRYVGMGSYGEVNKDGRTFILLADPDNWYFYFVHEDKKFENGRTQHAFKKHTCLHSPKEINADLLKYFKPGKDECISCKAKAKRKMYAMIPVYDLEYKTYRVIDTAEFHVNNIISDYDKIEKTMKKATKNPEYSIVGEAVHIKQVDKSYSMESGDATDEQLKEAQAFIGMAFDYVELANFREEDDIKTLLSEAVSGVDTSVLGEIKTSDEGQTETGLSEDNFEF
jgi:hypothetical protein